MLYKSKITKIVENWLLYKYVGLEFIPLFKPLKTREVGDHVLVKLSGGRIVEAEVKAVRETTEGVRLQVSFGEETALIYLWQVVEESR